MSLCCDCTQPVQVRETLRRVSPAFMLAAISPSRGFPCSVTSTNRGPGMQKTGANTCRRAHPKYCFSCPPSRCTESAR
jgi:hypothetical protein